MWTDNTTGAKTDEIRHKNTAQRVSIDQHGTRTNSTSRKSHLNYIQNVRCRFVSCPFLYIEKCTLVNANVYLLHVICAVYRKFNGLNAVLECNIECAILLLNMRPVLIISDFGFSCDAYIIARIKYCTTVIAFKFHMTAYRENKIKVRHKHLNASEY